MSGPHPSNEPMTGAQRAHLKLLSEEAQQPFDDSLTRAQASQRIEELQRITGGDPTISVAGEEDPGASLGQSGMRDAMQGEVRQVEKKDADRVRHGIQNMHEGDGTTAR